MTFSSLIKNSSHPIIMGVLNVTPDSFSDGGFFIDPDNAIKQAQKMIDEGADIIDIGGESSRPGAKPVTLEEELRRISPIIKALKKDTSVFVSVDTYKPEVMKFALEHEVDVINDIKALRENESIKILKDYPNSMVCLMHMQGTPETMQVNPNYSVNITNEIKQFLLDRLNMCVAEGINLERIILDPGFGFGKTFEHNWEIYQNLETIAELDTPLLIALSRKSMLKKIVGDDLKRLDDATGFFSSLVNVKNPLIIRTHNVGVTKKYLERNV
ncbi:MAG: dihydropteroate synthase [Betaproteobacteria bacterium]|nr:dihydropteroate synthase [Betaproteobacteria bacterium]